MGDTIGIVGGASFGGSARHRRCSFCGRREEAVGHLVRARGAIYICDRCVTLAQEAIAAAAPGQRTVRFRPDPVRLPDRDGAEEAIERAFETVFSSETTAAEACAAIDGGGNLAASMEEVGQRYAPARVLDVVVDSVRFLSADEAEVHFTLQVSRFAPAGMPRTGHAVRVGGEWKMARDTWCDLVALVGVQCPPRED